MKFEFEVEMLLQFIRKSIKSAKDIKNYSNFDYQHHIQ